MGDRTNAGFHFRRLYLVARGVHRACQQQVSAEVNFDFKQGASKIEDDQAHDSWLRKTGTNIICIIYAFLIGIYTRAYIYVYRINRV